SIGSFSGKGTLKALISTSSHIVRSIVILHFTTCREGHPRQIKIDIITGNNPSGKTGRLIFSI
ncbi:MAG: hypothetical protein U9R56_03380, partial [candidate division Zixibacteria bacterium]|nr:hypothetical protein [candidate division Zixibacteria bacterium]